MQVNSEIEEEQAKALPSVLRITDPSKLSVDTPTTKPLTPAAARDPQPADAAARATGGTRRPRARGGRVESYPKVN